MAIRNDDEQALAPKSPILGAFSGGNFDESFHTAIADERDLAPKPPILGALSGADFDPLFHTAIKLSQPEWEAVEHEGQISRRDS